MGRYETIRLLGEGGMGRVYLARQLDLGRQVVVKVMHDHIAADARFRERFARETLLMARFQHPYAVTLYDATLNDPEGPCIVMEYIKGKSLDTLLQDNGGKLEPVRVGRLLRQMCEVLYAAHSAGIIHRDLKPANLMIVEPDTPHELLKMMDFGLAKGDGFNPVTAPNTEFAVGTPGYMCPEQARGEEMDHRGDLYSVGVILYEMLTGQLPFAGRSTMDVLLAHATEDPPPFARFAAAHNIPLDVERVVQACLSKMASDRPDNARELADAFEMALTTEATTTLSEAARSNPTVVAPIPPRLGSHPAMPLPGEATGPNRIAPGALATQGVQSGSGSASQQTPLGQDPAVVVHQLEAWMPEKIATFKLRGFIQDVGGEVIESVPGKIRVRLGGRGSAYALPATSFGWLGLGRRSKHIDMELRLQRAEDHRENRLRVTVLLKPVTGDLASDIAYRQVCSQIFIDLRGYLIGHNGAVNTDSIT
jgi:serine/threonine-protein kinase